MSISKRTRKGKKEYRFIISYKENGEYRQKASKWFGSSAEAKRAEAVYKKEHPIITSADAMTYDDLFAEMLEDKKKTASPRTIKVYETAYRVHIKPSVGNKKFENVRVSALKKIFENDLSVNTHKAIKNVLRLISRYAERYHDIYNREYSKIDISKKEIPQTRALSSDEFEKFLNSVKEKDFRNLFYVLYWTGMRMGEALSLTFSSVKPTAIRVYRQAEIVNDAVKWIPTKNGKARNVAINSEIWQAIQEQKKFYSEQYPNEFNEEWFVFGGYRPLGREHARLVKNRAIKAAGIEHFRIHDLRHSHASYLIDKGVSIYKVSKRLGHASITITADRYGHLIDEDGAEILRAMSEKCQKND